MNSPITSGAIAGLSEILDYVLYKCNTPYVPLSGEIKLIENYLMLEKLRYDDRLRLSFDYNTGKEIGIAPLILLSLVENAFKHGASVDSGSPFISIHLSLKHNYISFKVANSFTGEEEIAGKGIGLSNVRRQLELLYPSRYHVDIQRINNVYSVELEIDLKEV